MDLFLLDRDPLSILGRGPNENGRGWGIRGRVEKNTYAVVEAEPGLQKLCVSGKGKKSSIHSLLFLTTEPGKTYFLEGSPGGDSLWGEGKPKVILVSDEKGRKAVKK